MFGSGPINTASDASQAILGQELKLQVFYVSTKVTQRKVVWCALGSIVTLCPY